MLKTVIAIKESAKRRSAFGVTPSSRHHQRSIWHRRHVTRRRVSIKKTATSDKPRVWIGRIGPCSETSSDSMRRRLMDRHGDPTASASRLSASVENCPLEVTHSSTVSSVTRDRRDVKLRRRNTIAAPSRRSAAPRRVQRWTPTYDDV